MGKRIAGWGRAVFEIGMDTFNSWSRHKIPLRAAAMSYYFLVTLAPLTLVFVYMISKVVGASDPASLLSSEVTETGVQAITQVVGVAERYSTEMGTAGPLISAGIALFGATVLLGNFTAAMDVIWDSTPEDGGVRYFVRRRVLGALGLFVIMIVALVVALFAAIVGALLGIVEQLVDGAITLPGAWDSVANLSWLIGLAFVTVLMSLAFTLLPQRKIRWIDTLSGSAITAIAYMVGQRVLGIYVDTSATISAWGAAGTFIALVVWIYYTMQVVLAGAELTRQLVLRAEKRRGDSHSDTDAQPEASS